MTKYLGKVYEGRWKVVELVHSDTNDRIIGYNLENIYNKRTIYICKDYMCEIGKGNKTISGLLRLDVIRNKRRDLNETKDY